MISSIIRERERDREREREREREINGEGVREKKHEVSFGHDNYIVSVCVV